MTSTRIPTIVLIASCLSLGAGSVRDRALIEFEIEDQFEDVHTRDELRGHPAVIVVSDREGSRYSGEWSRALREALESRVEAPVALVEVADLRGVPFFVKGSVRKKFPRDRRNRVWLDWKGAFAKAYGLTKKACNILVVDGDGRIVRRTAQTDLDPEIVVELMRDVERARQTQGSPGESRAPRKPAG